MFRKPLIWGFVALVIGLIALTVYFQRRVPSGLQPMGDGMDTLAWVSLATAIVSLLTAIVGLIKAVVEARARRG